MSASHTRARRHQRVILLSASALIALLLAELAGQAAFRLGAGHWLWRDSSFSTNTVIPYSIRVSDRREYALRPNYRDPARHLTIDGHGFRVTVPPPRDGERLVVNLGDSVPFGAGCCTDEDTYSSYLAQRFGQRGVRLGVVNAGVPSYNLRQSLDRFRFDVLSDHDWKRVAAVTLVAANDVSLVTYYGRAYTPDLTWGRDRQFISRRPEWQQLASAYYLGNLYDRLVRATQSETLLPADADPENEMLRHVGAMLRSELAVFQQHSVPVVLLSINPFYYQTQHQDRNQSLRVLKEMYGGGLPPQEQEWSSLINRMNDMLRQVSRDLPNVSFLDTRPAFDASDRDGLFADYIHFTPPGSQLTADLLLEHLSRTIKVRELASGQ